MKNYSFNDKNLGNIKKVFEEKTGVQLNTSQENKVYMKKKVFKTVTIAAAIVLLSITSVFAAMSFNFDVFGEFFRGDTSHIRSTVQTPREQVSDKRFTLTLEEVLTDNRYIFMVYSVEALTDDALKELMGGDELIYDNAFSYNISVSPSPGIITGTGVGYPRYARELVDRRTETVRYWAYYDEMEDVNAEPMTLRLETEDGDLIITVPTDTAIESKELTLMGQPYGDTYVRLSPLGITLKKGVKSGSPTLFTDVFFRMSNGEVKTFNQLKMFMSPASYVMNAGDLPGRVSDYTSYQFGARFHDVIPLSDFKSIIVGNTEYDINDPTKTSEATLNEKLYSFNVMAFLPVRGQGSFLPVKDVCDGLGAEMSWDGATLTVSYRGSTYEMTFDSRTYEKDGQVMAYQLHESSYIMLVHEDTLFMNDTAIQVILGIGGYQDYNSAEYIKEPVESSSGHDMWISRPVTPQYVRYYVIP